MIGRMVPSCFLTVLTVAVISAAPFYADKTRLLVYIDGQGQEKPISTPQEWTIRRGHILQNAQEVMGPLPDASRKVPLDPQVVEEIREPAYLRIKLTLAVEKDDRLPVWLLIPHQARKRDDGTQPKVPAVLVPHQTTRIGKDEPAGVGGRPDLHIAKHLAERGYVALAPDYPNYGEYTIDVYQRGYVSGTMKGIWNHMRCVDFLQTLPEVDPQRIGAIGHSLGGHNSIFVAVFDERIRCIVSNCGFNSFPRYMGGNLAGWSHKGYMPRIRERYELKPEKMPFDFTELVAALAPRPFLACAPLRDDNFDVQGVRECIAAATPVYVLHQAPQNLAAHYPDCAHEFPPEVRQVAYDWLDRHLKRK